MLRLMLVSFDIAVAWSSNMIQHVGLIIQHFEDVQHVGWPIQHYLAIFKCWIRLAYLRNIASNI